MISKKIYYLLFRYLILLLAGLNLWIFYSLITPLTIYPVFLFLKLFFSASLSGTTIMLKSHSIELVKPCIAGSAYFLLLILNLTTPSIKKRFLSIIFSFSTFLIINIIRILIFSILFIEAFSLFNFLHLIFWYALSSMIVVVIWLFNIKLFRIKKIPVYSDLRNVLKYF